MHYSCQERENKEKTQTIDHLRQFNHNMSTRTAPCRRGHVCASNDTTEGHIWPQESVSRTSLIAQACGYAGACGTYAHNFSIKKYNVKILKHPS
jgi:hypothetical protein